jgi:flavin reductase (DIM6/NTAB) family NADH-FMN oxidoreductase RutF
MPTAQLEVADLDRAPAAGEPLADPRAYRRALGQFGTGVCLVATRDADGTAHAITVNSFTSVSLDPPIVLWCLDNRSSQYERFAGADLFSINVLAADQQALSEAHARPGRPVLGAEAHEFDTRGVPLVRGALTRMSCRVRWREVAGDHLVIFATVLGFDSDAEGPGLGYFAGSYTVNRKS